MELKADLSYLGGFPVCLRVDTRPALQDEPALRSLCSSVCDSTSPTLMPQHLPWSPGSTCSSPRSRRAVSACYSRTGSPVGLSKPHKEDEMARMSFDIWHVPNNFDADPGMQHVDPEGSAMAPDGKDTSTVDNHVGGSGAGVQVDSGRHSECLSFTSSALLAVRPELERMAEAPLRDPRLNPFAEVACEGAAMHRKALLSCLPHMATFDGKWTSPHEASRHGHGDMLPFEGTWPSAQWVRATTGAAVGSDTEVSSLPVGFVQAFDHPHNVQEFLNLLEAGDRMLQ